MSNRPTGAQTAAAQAAAAQANTHTPPGQDTGGGPAEPPLPTAAPPAPGAAPAAGTTPGATTPAPGQSQQAKRHGADLRGKAPSQDEWLAERGLDPDPPGLPEKPADYEENPDTPEGRAYHEAHQKRQEWFGAHNDYLNMLANSGFTYKEAGINRAHEEGQAAYAGADVSWREALASDPKAREFQNSKDYNDFVRRFDNNPWVAFNNWRNMERAKSNPNRSDSVDLMSNGLYYSGGPNGDWYDKYGTKVGHGYVPGVTYKDGRDILTAWQANHPGQATPGLQYASGVPGAGRPAAGPGQHLPSQPAPGTSTAPSGPTGIGGYQGVNEGNHQYDSESTAPAGQGPLAAPPSAPGAPPPPAPGGPTPLPTGGVGDRKGAPPGPLPGPLPPGQTPPQTTGQPTAPAPMPPGAPTAGAGAPPAGPATPGAPAPAPAVPPVPAPPGFQQGLQLSRLPSTAEMAQLPPGTHQTPIGAIQVTPGAPPKIILNQAGQDAYKRARVQLATRFSPHPLSGRVGVPPPPAEPGMPNYDPFGGKWVG